MDEGAYVVTGASKGIGRAVAIQLAKIGIPIVALARNSNELNDIEKVLHNINAESQSIACDLAIESDVERACEIILENFPRISGIVHNAGTIHPVLPVQMASRSDWSRCLQVNLIGVQHLTQRLLCNMGGELQSRISAISSGASLRPVGSWSAYCVSKAGLDMWVRCIALEQQDNKISAISVAPGVVDTDMQSQIRAADPELFPDHSKFIALHTERVLSSSKDVARQLVPLLTNHTMAQSGQRFDVREL
tara:strand:+ start:95 stop:841 length:747 start_codon:yes stop_codon:yes gene_type:complete